MTTMLLYVILYIRCTWFISTFIIVMITRLRHINNPAHSLFLRFYISRLFLDATELRPVQLLQRCKILTHGLSTTCDKLRCALLPSSTSHTWPLLASYLTPPSRCIVCRPTGTKADIAARRWTLPSLSL